MEKIDVDKIKELIQDSYLRKEFKNFLDLILVVEYNYEHIVQLETLIMLLKGGLDDYHKTYYKDLEFLVIQCGYIAKNTYHNHYKENDDKLPDIHSLYTELLGGNPKILNFKNE